MQKTIVPCAAFDRAAAQKVLRQVLQKPDSTLCLATGDTTAGIFTRMVELKQALDLDCARVKCINMDEYVGVRREEPASCYFRIVRDLYAPLGLREDQFYVPVAPTSQAQQERERFARKLRGFGGIDFMLLSVGGNGHIAFNEPGADFRRAHSCGESYAEHAAGQGRIVWRCRQGSGAGSYAGYC